MAVSDDEISLEEVERELSKIDDKYSPRKIKSSKHHKHPNKTLHILSNEFDSLGLPAIDLSRSASRVFDEVINNAHLLVQIHRKTIGNLQDSDIISQGKDFKNAELLRKNESCRCELAKLEHKCALLQNDIIKLKHEIREQQKKESYHKEEIQKLKNYHASKQNEAGHHINKLTQENEHLKQIFGKDIGKYKSRDDITVELLNKYKINEEIYKNTIQKLQENNAFLVSEVLNLKEELCSMHLDNV